jgi:hypothetical protein
MVARHSPEPHRQTNGSRLIGVMSWPQRRNVWKGTSARVLA